MRLANLYDMGTVISQLDYSTYAFHIAKVTPAEACVIFVNAAKSWVI